jgi:hypothetical protein
MAAPQMYAVNNQWLGIAVEATPGTAVNPTIYIPLQNPQWAPKPTYLKDNSLVGSPWMYRDEVLGVIYYEFTMKMFLFADVWPFIMRSLLGTTDTVTGTTSPYTHTVGLLNNTTGSQPITLTVTWFDGHVVQQIAGCMVSKVDIAMKVDAAVEATIAFIGATNTSPSLSGNTYNAYHLMPSWATTFLLGTSQSYAVEEFDLNIERWTKPVFGAGQQGPRSVFQGPGRASGKYLCFFDTNDALAPNLNADSLARTQLATKVTFLDTVTNYTIAFQMSTTQFEDPTEPSDKEFLGSAANFEALGNSTDAISTGISGIKSITTNSLSSPAA